MQPHIAAWRDVYRSFGARPKKYPCSLEALLARVLKGQELPQINQLVDIYIEALRAAGEDLMQQIAHICPALITNSSPKF